MTFGRGQSRRPSDDQSRKRWNGTSHGERLIILLGLKDAQRLNALNDIVEDTSADTTSRRAVQTIKNTEEVKEKDFVPEYIDEESREEK